MLFFSFLSRTEASFSCLVELLLLLPAVVHELREEVDGQREDDGGVLLRGDGVQGLDKEIYLEESWREREGEGGGKKLGKFVGKASRNLQSLEHPPRLCGMLCVLPTCKYLSCRAEDDSAMTSDASFSARDAFCSPSAAMTFALASRAASASAAMALCSWTGRRASLLENGTKLLKKISFFPDLTSVQILTFPLARL